MNKKYIAPSVRTTIISSVALMSGSTKTMTIGDNSEHHEHDAEAKSFMDYGFNNDDE